MSLYQPYLHGVAAQSSSPELVRAGAALFAGLTAVDGATALALRSYQHAA